jgi:carbonic anhydrase/acetyltransferase-like protein (isoleucine patch superfamily)
MSPYFVAPGAIVVGDVTCAGGVNVWFGAVVRGDVAPITLGENVNLQDGVIVHCDFGITNTIEDGVVAGHAAILHGRRVGRGTLVGMRATLLGGTEIGEECLIAAGAVVPPGMIVPPRSVVMGVPGKIVRPARPDEIEQTRILCARYRALADDYLSGRYQSLDPARE